MALKITQTKGLSKVKKNQLATIAALGLGKIGRSVIQKDNPAIRGMIFTVKHLVSVEEVQGEV